MCDNATSCGSVGRGQLCLSVACNESGWLSFGLHTVNTSRRPDGGFARAIVESAYDEGLTKAFSEQKYDHYMDFSTVLFTKDLDRYIDKFLVDSVGYLPLSWQDDAKKQHYSVIVHIPGTQLVFELVSNTAPTKGKNPVADPLIRLPSSVFMDNPTSSASSSILVPLAVSKAVPSVEEVVDFYEKVFFANRYYNSSAAGAKVSFVKMIEGQTMALRFVERAETETFGPISVKEIQRRKVVAQKASKNNAQPAICGVSQWMDNHFSFGPMKVTFDEIKAKLDERSWPYQIWGAPIHNMYAVDSTGDAIQLNHGNWTNCSICKKASGDALGTMCSQGNCKSDAIVV